MSADDANSHGSLDECEFTLKFRDIFRYEFEGIVSTGGKCPQPLYDAMLDIAGMWSSNTQEIEGTTLS